MITDPIADMLTRIRNANQRYHPEVKIPPSKIKLRIAHILKEEGYISDCSQDEDGMITLKLKYKGKHGQERVISGLERVSRPSKRVYVGVREIPRVLDGLGIVILSTPQGVMTGKEARRRGVGGEVLCKVW
jgi:small subunit ribosomal protein S8